MINKWILNNFKSIGQEEPLVLPFRPLTIFTGANSSGKSTILQSILLVTQTLQSPISSRSIILNGWFKKFGSYSDIVNRGDTSKSIKIGFDIKNEETSNPRRFFSWSDDISSVSCNFDIVAGADDLQPDLERLELTACDFKGKKETLSVSKDIEHTSKEEKIITENGFSVSDKDFLYKLVSDRKIRFGYRGMEQELKVIGVVLNHFLPNYMISYYNRADKLKMYIRDVFSPGSIFLDINQAEESLFNDTVKDRIKKISEDLYNNSRKRNKKIFDAAYKKLQAECTIEEFHNLIKASNIKTEEKDKYITQFNEDCKKLSDSFGINRMPMYYQPGVEFVQGYFCDKIKYLGPLREEPKALYPLESNGDVTNVGLKGENTAAVYENNKAVTITYVDSASFKDLANVNIIKKTGTLEEAINNWLEYLGVANKIDTHDRGKIGHELKISTDSGVELDLTHVGVGVSQILPILVLSLLAKEGDVIILEQPELHLHPKVQTRLADFFVSMNAIGKQCIIESHSEYLINRLRYFVAVFDDSKVADDTMIYFVEKDGGHSKYRPVTINKYGVIEEWPDGFFDESEKIAADILRAGMEKKMKEDGQEYEE